MAFEALIKILLLFNKLHILVQVVFYLTLGVLGGPESAYAASPPRGDGTIRLYSYHLNDFAEVQFRVAESYLPAGLQAANQLLRSRGNQAAIEIAPELLDLADHLQDHFEADTIEVISGFRDKEFNASLLKGGHSVSPVSLHMKGRALDLHIDEIREETLRDYLISLKQGGVGYYGALDFVHADLGEVRQWGDPHGPRKLVGVLDPKAPVQLTSDRNDYLPGESLFFTWSLQEGKSLSEVSDLKLELFRRGKWTGCDTQLQPEKKSGLPSAAFLCRKEDTKPTYGKYRWTFKLQGKEDLLSSNEFYLKKL